MSTTQTLAALLAFQVVSVHAQGGPPTFLLALPGLAMVTIFGLAMICVFCNRSRAQEMQMNMMQAQLNGTAPVGGNIIPHSPAGVAQPQSTPAQGQAQPQYVAQPNYAGSPVHSKPSICGCCLTSA